MQINHELDELHGNRKKLRSLMIAFQIFSSRPEQHVGSRLENTCGRCAAPGASPEPTSGLNDPTIPLAHPSHSVCLSVNSHWLLDGCDNVSRLEVDGRIAVFAFFRHSVFQIAPLPVPLLRHYLTGHDFRSPHLKSEA